MRGALRRLTAGITALVRRRAVERELDDELRDYLQHLVDRKIAEGLTPRDARRAALAEMGSLAATKDAVRDEGWETAIESFWQDVRYAVRSLRRTPVFCGVTLLTLTLGIGANAAIFGVVNGLLLRPLGVSDQHQLVTLASARAIDEGVPPGWTYPVWLQIRRRADLFAGAFAWSGAGLPLRLNLAQRGEADEVAGILVSGEFFRVLRVSPVLGRTLLPGDDAHGGGDGAVAVISYAMWQRRFGGAADVIGRTLTIERVPFTIVGVTPADFLGPEIGQSFDVAIPLGTEPLIKAGRESWTDGSGPSFLTIVLRLSPGQSVEAATATLRARQAAIYDDAHPGDREFRKDFVDDSFALVPVGTSVTSDVRSRFAQPAVTLLAIVSVVLLIACANIANLQLSRALVRQRELDVRMALGASRWRLARQLLVESALLAGAGAGVGLVVAAWGSSVLVAQLSRFTAAPIALDLSLDWRVVTFTAVVGVLTMILFGFAAAVRIPRAAAAAALHRGRDGGTRPVRGRGGLVLAQVALSMVLLVAAGLFIRTFERLADRPSGFAADQVLMATVDTSRTPPNERTRLYGNLVEAAASARGVARAAASPSTPLSGSAFATLVHVADAPPPDRRDPPIPLYLVTPGWFSTYGSSILAGRDVEARDTASSEAVILVNQTFVRQFFPDGRVLGRQVRDAWAPPGATPQTRTVIGIVRDSILSSLWDVVPPTIYQPLSQAPLFGRAPAEITIGIRTGGMPPRAVAGGVAAAVAAVDGDLTFSFETLEERVNASIAQERLLALLSGFFGALALVLAAIGLYGLTAYGATQRRSEIGVRMALGAYRADVIRLVVRQTLTMTALGLGVGVAGAAIVTRYMQGMLFEISPLDPVTFASTSIILAGVAVVSALLPAHRAATVDPLRALRAE